MKFLFVCSGNTCRSPMAAAIARDLLGKAAEIHSAGVNAVDGASPAWEAVEVMRERGLDITGHRAKKISQFDPDDFDVVVTMDTHVACVLKDKVRAPQKKMYELNIDDPCGGGIDTYRRCAREIEVGLRRLFGGR